MNVVTPERGDFMKKNLIFSIPFLTLCLLPILPSTSFAQSPNLTGRLLGVTSDQGASLRDDLNRCVFEVYVAIDIRQSGANITGNMSMTVKREDFACIRDRKTVAQALTGTVSVNRVQFSLEDGTVFNGAVSGNTLSGQLNNPSGGYFWPLSPLSGTMTVTLPAFNYQEREGQIRQTLTSEQIRLNPEQRCFPNQLRNCNDVGGFLSSTVEGLVAFKKECSCEVVITGGSEIDSHSVGPRSHSTGYKVDISIDTDASDYIISRYTFQGFRGDGAVLYSLLPLGEGAAVFALEGNHWDITFPTDPTKGLNIHIQKEGEANGKAAVLQSSLECPDACNQRFSKGLKVLLTAIADQESRFAGWSEDIPTDQDRSNPIITLTLSTNETITASFVERPDDGDRPPDGDPKCWKWDSTAGMGRGGWVWDCSDDPPPGGGSLPKPIDDLCWDWEETAGPMRKGGWVLIRCEPPPGDAAGLSVTGVGSFDPNDKVGSQGAGVAQYISGEESLRYVIYFENVATATAPAHEVVITDQLDIAKLDLDTFSLGHIAFGDKLITPPPSFSQFTRDVDLRPAKKLIVRINASLNKTTGLLTWRFTSIDPDTGLPPEDPFAGFLPPNKNPPEGDGSVLFTVMPKKGLDTGTEIRNKASIVFDANAPIDTPEWLNTIDDSNPSSQVLALTPQQTTYRFEVKWAGTDSGSGVQSYTVFVSENGGTYTAWLQNTAPTSAVFGQRWIFSSTR